MRWRDDSGVRVVRQRQWLEVVVRNLCWLVLDGPSGRRPCRPPAADCQDHNDEVACVRCSFLGLAFCCLGCDSNFLDDTGSGVLGALHYHVGDLLIIVPGFSEVLLAARLRRSRTGSPYWPALRACLGSPPVGTAAPLAAVLAARPRQLRTRGPGCTALAHGLALHTPNNCAARTKSFFMPPPSSCMMPF